MSNRIAFCLSAALILSAYAPAASARQSASATQGVALPLHTNGCWIVDAKGTRVRLNSVNWYGAEEQDFVVAGLEIETLPHIAHRIKTMGFNSVRLPWSNEMYESNPIVPDYAVAANPNLMGKNAMAIFDDVVHALAKEGLFIILDNHMSDADWCCSGSDGNTLWYNADYPESSWIADWQGMVRRYADIPEAIGVDLRNEPRSNATWGGSSVTDWHAAAERGGNAVLKANPKLLIFVEGINYALDLTGVANLPVVLNVPNRLVYSAHDYSFDHNGVTSESQLFQTLDTNWGYIVQSSIAPVWVGEFGNCHDSSSCVAGLWMTAFRDYLNARELDWSWWAINGTAARGTGRTFGGEETYGILNPYWNAPAIPSELNPPPTVNVLGVLQTAMQPAAGPKVNATPPPLVSMVMPIPGSVYMSGAIATLIADAAVRNGSISEVQFFANGQMIGTVSTSPFTLSWTKLQPGNYSITAVAVAANSGLSSTSAPVEVSVIDYSARGVNYGDSISMDFGDYNVAPMQQTEVAGVIPRQNWNGAYGNSGEFVGLVNQSGAATAAYTIWTSPGMYYTTTPDQPGNDRMMRGYQDSSNTVPVQIQVSGIPYGLYDVYVYFDGNNGAAARESNYRLFYTTGGCSAESAPVITGTDAANVDFSGTFIQASGSSAGNYVLFPGCSGSSFTLLGVHGGSADSQYRAPVNGVQIVAVKRASH